MIELTRDDLAAIRSALGERYPIDERDQAIYRAGLAAGIERAAKVCDDKRKPAADVIVGAYRQGHDDGCDRCAAAIRALLK